jgi:hypothetical protein
VENLLFYPYILNFSAALKLLILHHMRNDCTHKCYLEWNNESHSDDTVEPRVKHGNASGRDETSQRSVCYVGTKHIRKNTFRSCTPTTYITVVGIITTYFNIQELCLLTDCVYAFRMIGIINSDFSVNSFNRLNFVMKTCFVSFEVRTELQILFMNYMFQTAFITLMPASQ